MKYFMEKLTEYIYITDGLRYRILHSYMESKVLTGKARGNEFSPKYCIEIPIKVALKIQKLRSVV